MHAYLGMLDVQPLDNPLQGRETKPVQITFRAQRIAENGRRKVWRVEGTYLPAGRPIQLDSAVRYGIIAEKSLPER